MTKVRKAVIPVAGLGTRFLPATKALAKEMLQSLTNLFILIYRRRGLKSGIEETCRNREGQTFDQTISILTELNTTRAKRQDCFTQVGHRQQRSIFISSAKVTLEV